MENIVIELFEDALEKGKGSVYTTVVEVIERAAEKSFFTGGADKLPDENMYKLVECQDITKIFSATA